MVARVAEVLGHTPIIETNSILAVTKHVHGGKINVAIVDYKMPFVDGIEVLSAFEQSSPGTRRVLLTASPEEQEVQAALAMGIAQMVLKKPATLNDFEPVFLWLEPG